MLRKLVLFRAPTARTNQKPSFFDKNVVHTKTGAQNYFRLTIRVTQNCINSRQFLLVRVIFTPDFELVFHEQ